MTITNAERLITAKEAADRLGYTASNTRKLCAQGKIKGAKKIKGHWVMPLRWSDHVDNYKYIQSIPVDYMHRMEEIQQEMRHEAARTFNRIRSVASVRAGFSRLCELEREYIKQFDEMSGVLLLLGDPKIKKHQENVYHGRSKTLRQRFGQFCKGLKHKSRDGGDAEQ